MITASEFARKAIADVAVSPATSGGWHEFSRRYPIFPGSASSFAKSKFRLRRGSSQFGSPAGVVAGGSSRRTTTSKCELSETARIRVLGEATTFSTPYFSIIVIQTPPVEHKSTRCLYSTCTRDPNCYHTQLGDCQLLFVMKNGLNSTGPQVRR